jgi:acyl-coenzyme A synthetase/AMP-(fatty) acid ligase
VAAIVVVREASPPEEDLQEFLKAELAYYKVPTRWQLTKEPLPRNATGKVRRAELTL